MIDQSNYRAEFVRVFNSLCHRHNPHRVFDDFVTMAACSLRNSLPAFKSARIEEIYMETVKRYEKAEVDCFPALFACTVMALEDQVQDFLGSIYMELELGNRHSGQFFTPYSVSKLCAQATMGKPDLNGEDFVTVQDPAIGSASMPLAYVEMMLSAGYNPQQHLWVSGIDVDWSAACMAYIQLSLLHIPGEIVVGNSLTMEFREVLRTPAHHLGLWDIKLKARRNRRAGAPDTPQSDASGTSGGLVSIRQPGDPTNEEQLDLFDIVV